ncbi:GTP-binding protein HflX [Desulfitobacterium dichloroeliminans LMG P-21439]|uniref:GTPase HflX n=1 Tax=Desulfitobacterium dichloroeliminans (strain LMG P-21439 / DCA1) TaxID=871963 RepID=L0F9G4_DESDL|nr:GTPase HflX [Desulfitobacterium dichloroeliminans]AGA69306.1 GTP-binding protein HflX [Desulfitobacterium dichloroeliminans LMG P-21439]
MDILGDIAGIRGTQLKDLKELTLLRTERPGLIHFDLLEGICKLTSQWNKEIALYINRSGIVIAVAVGQHATVKLPPLPARQAGRLRCIHTHPSGNEHLSSMDLSALSSTGLESMSSLGVKNGQITGVEIAFPGDSGHEILNLTPKEFRSFSYDTSVNDFRSRPASPVLKISDQEKAFLVALEDEDPGYELLSELAELALTAGVEVVGKLLQPKRFGSPVSYLGKGKLQELTQHLQDSGANVLICDDELLPVQQRTLEQATGIKVLDRTTLILDIFALRAKSREGKLQVELAQLKHLLPRLSGQGINLSRLGGGVGTRGPGESKLEMDKRRVRKKINLLEAELIEIRKVRTTQRRQREKSGIPLIALVGYTNAGKTTLLQKAMEQTRSKGEAIQGEDKLFATLDPIVRGIKLNQTTHILLSDTVGFIQKLPHQLLHAFLATLEEVQNADILIHVLDASHPRALERADTVHGILGQLECSNKPRITLLNKTDKISHPSDLNRLAQELSHPIPMSLTQDSTLEPVWNKVLELLSVDKDETN